ncbi:spore-specific ATP-dependent protease LonB [Candidatus Hydrogenisulfobacillus filiaventi]|uniref:endopeptidase La n=1 Tax=Candidatus Hydrogenisulfobacillus filiaventi TaxID=2707344 RepID=A0A6F8ZJ54_9FIRM|nr:spore-specific ATP-dependent protease LonB [Candidatus Hydrogenisulfobacillus filiaventi]
MSLATLVNFVQFFFVVVAGLYFWSLLRGQQGSRVAVERESRRELEKLHHLRSIHLTVPLAERTRPASFADIVGQDDGIRALRAALCGPHPQHVLLYGPPGVGKTAAARLVLEEAKRNPLSPFGPEARFVEVDATTARFDERGIADPLIGTVHDPIYQGAGPLGMAGIPQPKPGAVTKAHGGILFIDEIGELHPIQMNKLLKVLEDRRVFLESAYYNRDDHNIPLHIQDIFENGLPADFRLVGATTRQPQELPPALRSRCVEIFFRGLDPAEVGAIAEGAARRAGMDLEGGALAVLTRYAHNGREAVNMIQIAAGLAVTEGTGRITQEQMEWVVSSGRYTPRLEGRVSGESAVGVVNGLAVTGPGNGLVLEVEAVAQPAEGAGSLTVTGVVDEEEMGAMGRTVRRRSTARASVENVLTVLRTRAGIDPSRYHLHVNFPGGVPLDGPSAGVAVATAVFSAITGRPVDGSLAMTGELTIRGAVRPVGGISDKVEAARRAGCRRVLIPRGNWQARFARLSGLEVVPVESWEDVVRWACGGPVAGAALYGPAPAHPGPAAASPASPPGFEAGS